MVKIFADGADLKSILELNRNPLISGFTTNPALMRKTGITDYRSFAFDVLSEIKDKPVSFEVLSDDFNEMLTQALNIADWGANVYVKIPIINTKGRSTYHLIEELTLRDVKVNVTAIMTLNQIIHILPALRGTKGTYLSIFAGRIADTGVNPTRLIKQALYCIDSPNIKILWASPREVLNIYQAEIIGCHIITCTPDLICKYESLKGKDLIEYSRETVEMFYKDGQAAGLRI